MVRGILSRSLIFINALSLIDIEDKALMKIRDRERIPLTIFRRICKGDPGKKTEGNLSSGIDLINSCDDQKKLKAFVHLLKISEIDGSVHVKEVRLLLYSIKMADVEFNAVVCRSGQDE